MSCKPTAFLASRDTPQRAHNAAAAAADAARASASLPEWISSGADGADWRVAAVALGAGVVAIGVVAALTW